MLLKSLHLKGLLSFGLSAGPVELGPLNVLIGANGSGKSNFLEAISLLQAAPGKLTSPIRDGGGVGDWLWRPVSGAKPAGPAEIDAIFEYTGGLRPLRYVLAFSEVGGRFHLDDERIENDVPQPGEKDVFFFYHFNHGRPQLSVQSKTRQLKREDVDPELSILAQRRDPDSYPEITFLAAELAKIRLFREWSFGRYSTPRLRQPTDAPADFLEADSSNLGLVLNGFDPPTKKRLLTALRSLYEGIEDVQVRIVGGSAQVFLQEQDRLIPATRLSDGTLRYLSMLAVLCHPTPPPLVVIEEPELGLHPDVLPTLAALLRESSERTQLVVTTHSAALVDSLSDSPESVLVCERDAQGTRMERLDAKALEPWLQRFRLGQLWTRGEIGGTRW